MGGPDPVLELLDVVLHPAAGQVIADQAAAGSDEVGDHGGIEVLADDPLLLLVPGGALDQQSVVARPALGPVMELRPLGLVLPGVGLPSAVGKRFNRGPQALGELGADAEAEPAGDAELFHVPGVEAGVHPHPHPSLRRHRLEHLLEERHRAVARGAMAGAQSSTQQHPILIAERQERMVTADLAVAVRRSLLEVAMDLEDRAVGVEGERLRTADAREQGACTAALDPLELVDVTERERAQSLAGGGRCRHLEPEAQFARHGLFAQHLQVTEAVATDHEVGGQPHHEVLDRNATAALLHGEGPEVVDQPKLLGQFEYESQPGERGRVMRSGLELDAAETAWNLHLTSAPSLERETTSTTLPYQAWSTFSMPFSRPPRLHPLVTRGSGLNELVPARGPAYLPRLGRAVLTPILMISNPEAYGVCNNVSEKGLRMFSLWPERRRSS